MVNKDMERFIGNLRLRGLLGKLGIKSAKYHHTSTLTSSHLEDAARYAMHGFGMPDQIIMNLDSFKNVANAFGNKK